MRHTSISHSPTVRLESLRSELKASRCAVHATAAHPFLLSRRIDPPPSPGIVACAQGRLESILLTGTSLPELDGLYLRSDQTRDDKPVSRWGRHASPPSSPSPPSSIWQTPPSHSGPCRPAHRARMRLLHVRCGPAAASTSTSRATARSPRWVVDTTQLTMAMR
jgi:hypothetical protein